MRAMRADGFSGYKDLKLVDIPKPALSDGRVLVKIIAAGVTPLDYTTFCRGTPTSESAARFGRRGSGTSRGGREPGVMFCPGHMASQNGAYSLKWLQSKRQQRFKATLRISRYILLLKQ